MTPLAPDRVFLPGPVPLDSEPLALDPPRDVWVPKSFEATEAGPMAAAPFAAMCRVMAEGFTDAELDSALDIVSHVETEREGPENELQVRRLLRCRFRLDTAELDRIEDELAERLLLSMSAESAMLGILWERRRRRLRRRAH